MVKKSDSAHVYKPHTLREALNLLREYPSLRCVAGGTDLMLKLKEGAPDAVPAALLSLAEVDELTKIRRRENTVEIGAAVPLERIISLGGNVVPPLLVKALCGIAGQAVRNLATLGGNIVLASPFSDAILPLILFEARCELRRFNAHTWAPLSRLVKAPWKFTLEPGEILTEISLPIPQWDVRQYVKLDIMTQPSLSQLRFAGLAKVYKATISDFRVAWGGVDPLHLRNRELEAMVIGSKIPFPPKLKQQFTVRVKQLIEKAPPAFLPATFHRQSAVRLALAFWERVSSHRPD